MLHEFALEPGLLNSWDRFRLYTEEFGHDKGRLISRYPKTWKSLVYDAITNCSELERKRIEVKLQALDSKMVAGGRDWNQALDWLSNAERVHSQWPFRAIIARSNPRGNDDVVLDVDLHDSPQWKVPTGIKIDRTAEAMANAMAPLIRRARNIIFADPHFSPGKPKSRKALEAFVKRVEVPAGSEACRVEFHTLHVPENSTFEADCQRELAKRIPLGLKLLVIRWRTRTGGDGFHNRYVFTENGGVQLAWGLDEGQPSETDDVTLLDHSLFLVRRQQFIGEPGEYELVDKIVVTGTAR